MGGSRLMKRVRNNDNHIGRHCSTTIECLPNDLLLEIVAMVASDSFADLFNLKLCSRHFLDVTQDDYIYRHVSLQKFPLIHWFPISPKKSSFLNHCKECGNLESLYREGMLQYFSRVEFEVQSKGFHTLQVAAHKGHKEAMYVVAMVLLCRHGEEEAEAEEQRKLSHAIQYLRFLRMCKCVVRCRKRVEACLWEMWINNRVVRGHKKFLCDPSTCKKGWRIKRGRWVLVDDEDDENDVNMCEYCRWDHELTFFYNMLNVH